LEKGVVTFNSCHGFKVHDIDEAFCSAVENDGNKEKGVGGEEDGVGEGLGAFIKALFEELGNGGDASAQEFWQEEDRHEDEGDNGDNFPSHNAKTVFEG